MPVYKVKARCFVNGTPLEPGQTVARDKPYKKTPRYLELVATDENRVVKEKAKRAAAVSAKKTQVAAGESELKALGSIAGGKTPPPPPSKKSNVEIL